MIELEKCKRHASRPSLENLLPRFVGSIYYNYFYIPILVSLYIFKLNRLRMTREEEIILQQATEVGQLAAQNFSRLPPDTDNGVSDGKAV